MRFKNHVLDGYVLDKARWIGGQITPEIVILHDTASRLDPGSAATYLRDNERKVSVHFVIERDGATRQQVPINRRANHAGSSNYHGRKHVNRFSIGIELVNPGRLERHGQDRARAWFGKTFDIEETGIEAVTTREHGHGLWMPYPEAQIEALITLLGALFDHEGNALTDITTHWYISPGRKVDTNPLFPLETIRSLIFGREEPLEDWEAAIATDVTDDEFVQIETPNDSLNLRRWPSFNPNVIAEIPDGAIVPLLKYGEFDGREWLKVRYGDREGWIVARYAADITFPEPGERP